MPLQPNLIERQLIRTGIIPGLMLDVALPIFQFWAVIGAAEIGLFEHLQDEAADAETLAQRTDAKPDRMRLLLDCLVNLGHVQEKNGTYELSKAARRSLPAEEIRKMAPFFKDQMTAYMDVGRALREDPPGGIAGWERVQSGEAGRGYQAAMRWLASGTVDEVVKKVELPNDAKRMIDVGGSHGLYAVAFCRKYPELRAAVLDWPIGLEEARRTLDENPDMADRIELIERDFEKEELPGGFDFAFLGNIIHGISAEGNRNLFRKLAGATTEIGTVGILDQFAGISGTKFARTVASLIGFNLFLFSGGRAYPYEDVSSWLADAGFQEADLKSLRQPGFSLVVAKKSA